MQKSNIAENGFVGWVEDAAKGRHDAFARLYQQFSGAMYNVCIRMVREKSLAEDLLQEAFLTAFDNLKNLREPARFGGWLKQITVRKCIQSVAHQYDFSTLQEHHEHSMEAQDDHWWDGISMAEIQSAIKELPDGCRQIFNLYAVEDYSHREIAELLRISESTSKSQYHRAKGLLRNKLSQYIKTLRN
ncbi:MAG: sigma-70 family RNA polymerase sigma factor [Chitinophagaceae bacterium]